MTIELEPQRNKGIKFYSRMLKHHWKLFALSIFVFVTLGYLYTKFATPQYLISSAILVEGQPTPTDPSSAFSGGLTSVLNTAENLKNEGDVLRTRALMKETVNALHLNVRMYTGSGLLSTEIYNEAPFKVKISHYRVDTLKLREYKLQILNDNKVHISNSDDNLDANVQFNKTIRLPQYDLVLEKKPGFPITPTTYSTQIVSEEDATTELLKGYDAEFSDKTTSAIDITFYYPNSLKGEAILQHLMNQYLKDNVATKRRVMDSMLTFLNDRINSVSKDLTNIEKDYQDFRSANTIADMGEQSKALVGQSSIYYNQLQTQKIQLSVITQLEKYLSDPSNKQVIPGSASIQDASFTTALNDYNNLIQQREKKLLSFTETNPIVTNIDQQISIARANLLQNVENYRHEIQIKGEQLGNQNKEISGAIQKVPQKQTALVNFGRQQELKQQLYLYLLQKREETALAKTSNVPTSRIIDPAKSSKGPAKPLKPLIYLLSMLLGFIIPFGYVNSKTVHHVRIKNEEDIQNQTDISIIGKIGHSTYSNRVLVENTAKSTVTESFRTLRAKIQNILDTDEPKIIMVTSSINGEGKTFVSANLGNILAKTDKRVLLMELDLRKPKLSGLFSADSESVGFSDYILGNADLTDIIKPTDISENLYLISSGPVVANASELLLHRKTKLVFEELKTLFDYIIIDSSPVGLVSDALIIEKYADMTIFICRHNYTNTEQMAIVNQLKTKDNIENMYLVINDVDFATTGYFGYGYGLGYDETRRNK